MNRSRRPLIAGNWKMHHGGASGIELASAVAEVSADLPMVESIVAPPYTALAAVSETLREVAERRGQKPVGLSAQNLHFESKGAFTGEVSPAMLVDAGCHWVIVGHSERRQHFHETDALVARKCRAALAAGLTPIICVGETLEERTAGTTLDVVLGQLAAVLEAIAEAKGTAVIAYEPVWAIGTGKVATPADAQTVQNAIRRAVAIRGPALADSTRILYGGSVKKDNAYDLLAQPDVDGALVGGASLEIDQFGGILRAAQALAAELSS